MGPTESAQMPKEDLLGNLSLVDLGLIMVPSWAPKTEPRGSKIEAAMESNRDPFLKTSSSAVFAVKCHQRCARVGPDENGPKECAGSLVRI